MEEEAHDLLVTIDREIRRRNFGAVVRLEVHPDTPQRIREFLLSKLEIEEDDLYEERGVLGASALMSVAMLSRADLHDVPFVQNLNHALAEAQDPFAVVRQGDILLPIRTTPSSRCSTSCVGRPRTRRCSRSR